MTNEEAITILRRAVSEVEWEYPIGNGLDHRKFQRAHSGRDLRHYAAGHTGAAGTR